MIIFLSDMASLSGYIVASLAMAPDTIGVEKDVPENIAYLPNLVLSTCGKVMVKSS